MRLPDLLNGWAPGCPDIEVTGLSLDSRTARPGHAFVAVRGTRGHGLDYAPQAVAAGCRVILHDGGARVPRMDVPAVRIDGLGRRLGELASRFFGAPSELLTVAGVTGTNGKTSVTHFLAQAWQRVHGCGGLVGTLGYGPIASLTPADRTTPDPFSLQATLADCVARGCEHVAMEVSSHALEQGRCQTVQFDAAVFTNLSHDHLDYHGDMARYAAAKRRLFTDFAPRFAIVNLDDETGRTWHGELNGGMEVLGYGLTDDADLRAEILDVSSRGQRLRLTGPWGSDEVQVGLLGRFNVSNLLAVAGTLSLLGMRWHQVIQQLEMMQDVPGRMMHLGGGPGQPLVVVDYAHTPDALQKVLETLRTHVRGRLVCVFGCGGDRDRAKRPDMGRVAESLADRVIVTSDNPRHEDPRRIFDDVAAGLVQPDRAEWITDRSAAIQSAIASSRAGDIVLVAGKGHEAYQEIGARRIPFSDETEVRAALEAAA